MADTTKIYENIFIKKNAAGDREYIKVPYAILADPPTIPDVSGFIPKSGGTFTGNVTITSGHLNTDLIKSSDNTKRIAEITEAGLEIGDSGTPLRLYSSTRPVHANANKELAYTSDIPTDYVPNTRKVNNKALSSDITLGASDVGALPTTGGAVTGNLTVGGNLTVNGTTTTVDSTTLQVKDKLIEVAHGNNAALTTPAGLVAPKYDGTNSGALVFDSTGTAYVGDVKLDSTGNIDVVNSKGLQPLATRTGLVGGNLVQYDSTALTLKDSGKKISDLATTSQVNAKYTKPSGGIPKTDLASDVQTSLGKADSALQAKDISGKLDKTTYEVNKTIAFGSSGVLYVGKFKVYDTNVTCEVTSTTDVTYSGKLVIATQNYVINQMTVYGDAANTVAPNFFIKPSTTSDPYIEVYFKPASWSKNVVHIYGSEIKAEPTDVCTNVPSVPSTATLKPKNALDSKANLSDGNTFDSQQIFEDITGTTTINGSYVTIQPTGAQGAYSFEVLNSNNTTAFSINGDSYGRIKVGSPVELGNGFGTSGQVLTSQGAGETPTWTTPAIKSVSLSGTTLTITL